MSLVIANNIDIYDVYCKNNVIVNCLLSDLVTTYGMRLKTYHKHLKMQRSMHNQYLTYNNEYGLDIQTT